MDKNNDDSNEQSSHDSPIEKSLQTPIIDTSQQSFFAIDKRIRKYSALPQTPSLSPQRKLRRMSEVPFEEKMKAIEETLSATKPNMARTARKYHFEGKSFGALVKSFKTTDGVQPRMQAELLRLKDDIPAYLDTYRREGEIPRIPELPHGDTHKWAISTRRKWICH
jgi:hypothetical protein